jgi:SAM-dependent methyltransferase
MLAAALMIGYPRDRGSDIDRMIADAFLWVLNRTPSLRRAMWRFLFDLLAWRFRNIGWWTLMNYGFADLDPQAPRFALQPPDEPERYPIALYHHIATLALIGLDLSGKAVLFSNRQHRVDTLEFQQGDAENLPFPDGSFDSVLNVESSFCYPSIDRFFSEVKRVLRPGGHLHYTDLRLAPEMADWRKAIARSGLEMLAERDISANVIEALHRDSARRREGGRRILSGPLSSVGDVFTGVDGTRIPSMLASGGMAYWSFLLRKPAA